MSKKNQAMFANSSVLINKSPIDLRSIIKECDVAVLRGGHGTVCEFLRAGVPMLLLPMALEQQLTGQRLKDLRVGEYVADQDLNRIGGALEQLLEDASYRNSAQAIAKKYAEVTEEDSLKLLVDDIQGLMAV